MNNELADILLESKKILSSHPINQIKNNKVLIFIIPTCPYCKLVMNTLKDYNIKYK
jgi:hypothetical protein